MRISDWSSDVCSSDLRKRRRKKKSSARPPPRLPVTRSRSKTPTPTTRRRIELRPCFHPAGTPHGHAAAARSFPSGGTHGQDQLSHPRDQQRSREEIGRASCRERVCQYV